MKSEKSISQADDVMFWNIEKNFDINLAKDVFFIGSRLHYHPTVEIYFWLEGKCSFFVDDQSYDLTPGDIIFSPAGVLHKTSYNPNLPISRFLIYCESSLLPKAVQEFCADGKHYIGNVSKIFGNVEELFRKILHEYEHPDKFSDDMIKSHLSALAVLLFRHRENSRDVQLTSKNRLIESTVSFIKNNYSSHITLDDAAKHAAVSSKYLSHLFKKDTGFNFNEYLTLYRLKESEFRLMEYPDKSILEIAYDCGFNDSNYFSTRFKKVYGVTPSQFRKGDLPNPPKSVISSQ